MHKNYHGQINIVQEEIKWSQEEMQTFKEFHRFLNSNIRSTPSITSSNLESPTPQGNKWQ